jgi:hypothetical protein
MEFELNSTFLHEDKVIPPDEAVDTDAPLCAGCQRPMWLTKVKTKHSDGYFESLKVYVCKSCGRTGYVCHKTLGSSAASIATKATTRSH